MADAAVLPYTIAAGAVGSQATGEVVTYWGCSLWDANGSSPVVKIHDSGAVSGKVIEVVSFLPNESVREGPFDRPVAVAVGVYVELVSGTMPVGTLRLG